MVRQQQSCQVAHRLRMKKLAMLIEVIRPRTLVAAVVPVVTGAAVALHAMNRLQGFNGITASMVVSIILALMVALFLQIAANVCNDIGDFQHRADDHRQTSQTQAPRRLLSAGLIQLQTMLTLAGIAMCVACVSGIALVLQTRQYWLLAVGCFAILATWCYTASDHPYGYKGFGEIVVFIFFGLVSTIGTAVVLLCDMDMPDSISWIATAAVVFSCALANGLHAVQLMIVNNLRDLRHDAAVGKQTMVVKLGYDRALSIARTVMIIAVVSSGITLLAMSARRFGMLISQVTGSSLIELACSLGLLLTVTLCYSSYIVVQRKLMAALCKQRYRDAFALCSIIMWIFMVAVILAYC